MFRQTTISILLFLLTACGTYDGSVSVGDVTTEQSIVLKNSKGGRVYSYSIRGTGHIDGKATATLMLDGKPYRTEQLDGPVRFKWGGDWYSDTAVIVYRPDGVRSGTLIIEYGFRTTGERG